MNEKLKPTLRFADLVLRPHLHQAAPRIPPVLPLLEETSSRLVIPTGHGGEKYHSESSTWVSADMVLHDKECLGLPHCERRKQPPHTRSFVLGKVLPALQIAQ